MTTYYNVMFQIDNFCGINVNFNLPFSASFRVNLANFIKTRCMVTQPSCSAELEFPRVNLLAMDSFALQMIGVDEYETSKQTMM